MKAIDKINKIENERTLLLKRLLETKEVLFGSFNIVYRKCGKLSCWCYNAQLGHEYKRISWRDKQSKTTRALSVSKEIEVWVKLCIDNYHEYKTMQKQINVLNDNLQLILDELLEIISQNTKNVIK